MKLQFEEINTPIDSSFRILMNPKLNDFFLWHFHPEYELVYIEAEGNTRHVGHHTGQWEGSDLIFIGSNIPHLNFDYGIKGDHHKAVVQVRSDFLDQTLPSGPEMISVRQLFKDTSHGIVFSQSTKEQLGDRLNELEHLPPFQRFMEMLDILHLLSQDEDRILLHEKPYQDQYSLKEKEKLKAVYKYIDDHYTSKITIADVAILCGLSREGFCRYFKKMTQLTFTQFLNHYRVNVAKRLLIQGHNVSETCFATGFESLSYFNRVFKKTTMKTPMAFRKGVQGK